MAERDVRLDGFRGVGTIAVVVSHFFAEVPSGIAALGVGFYAVYMYFVLSGFLIGRLILERKSSQNFFKVFYARRFLRTIPSYAVVLFFVLGATAFLNLEWIPAFGHIPAWSYPTFTQNIFMASRLDIGSEWLGPTWTLAVEEQFYLIAPLALILIPGRYLLASVVIAASFSIFYRFYGFFQGEDALAYLPTLLGNADALALGIGAGALQRRIRTAGPLFDRFLEVLPLGCVLLALAFVSLLPDSIPASLFMRPLVALGLAAYILRIALNSEICSWLRSPFLCSAGHHSYSIYLVHIPVAGLTHGLLTGLAPDIGTIPQLAATVLSIPVTIAIALVLTKTVEDPATLLGRRFKWIPKESRNPATTT